MTWPRKVNKICEDSEWKKLLTGLGSRHCPSPQVAIYNASQGRASLSDNTKKDL